MIDAMSVDRGSSRQSRRTFGLRRLPVVVLVTVAVTAAVNVIQLAVPGTLENLERTSAGLHGDWWRTGTALLVQDGGVFGTVSNLLFLTLIGAAAEQVMSRRRLVATYIGIGMVGEVFGYLWQPTGGGNSVAICGLSGALAIACFQDDDRLPVWAATVQLVWCGALLGTAWYPLIALGLLAGRYVFPISMSPLVRRLPLTRELVLVGTTVVAVALFALRNIHGGALAAGLLLAAAWLVAVRRRDPVSAGPG